MMREGGGVYYSHLLNCACQLQKWRRGQEAEQQEAPVVVRVDGITPLLQKVDDLVLSGGWDLHLE